MASEVEKILIEFANKVLDVRNGKGNPTLGELVDEPEQALTTYIDSVVEQVIGKDEPADTDYGQCGDANNLLRQEQRHRYEQMKGKK